VSTTLLTLQQAAAETGIPLATLYALRAPAGDLPVVRIGKGRGRIYVDRADLATWIERRKRKPVETTVIGEAVTTRSISHLPGASRYAQ
jgi:hypothetical protein